MQNCIIFLHRFCRISQIDDAEELIQFCLKVVLLSATSNGFTISRQMYTFSLFAELRKAGDADFILRNWESFDLRNGVSRKIVQKVFQKKVASSPAEHREFMLFVLLNKDLLQTMYDLHVLASDIN